MTHHWFFKRHMGGFHLQHCRVLARGNGRGPRNVLVEFSCGCRVVSTRFCVRRIAS